MRVHLCGAKCEEALDAENLLHGEEIRIRSGQGPAWMMNLVEEGKFEKEADVEEPPKKDHRGGEGKG